jgi:hypothetical protein
MLGRGDRMGWALVESGLGQISSLANGFEL